MSEGRYATEAAAAASGGLLFAGSVLGPVAAAAVASDSATHLLEGFDNSPEAAQLNAEVHARSTDGPGEGAWHGGGGGLNAMGDGGGGGM